MLELRRPSAESVVTHTAAHRPVSTHKPADPVYTGAHTTTKTPLRTIDESETESVQNTVSLTVEQLLVDLHACTLFSVPFCFTCWCRIGDAVMSSVLQSTRAPHSYFSTLRPDDSKLSRRDNLSGRT